MAEDEIQQASFAIGELADRLGRSYCWTQKTLNSLKIQPVRYEQRKSRRTALYRKSALNRLKRQLLETSEGRYNLHELMIYTGHDRAWVKRRLSEAGITSELRQSVLTGKVLPFYPAKALQNISGITSVMPAGDWLTATALASAVGKSVNWTNRRLDKPAFKRQKQLRLDDQSVPRWHYSQSVLRELQGKRRRLEQYPEANGYVTIDVLAVAVGRHVTTVQRYLKKIGIAPEQRRDKKGRLTDHFALDSVEKLRDAFGSFTPAGKWLTATEMARTLKVPREVVTERLQGIGARPERRMGERSRRADDYYSLTCLSRVERSLKENPYDELVDASTAQARLRDLQRRYSLSQDQIAAYVGLSTSVKGLFRQQRMRRSLEATILSARDPSIAEVACLSVPRKQWLLENIREQAIQLGRDPNYTNLRTEWLAGNGFDPMELFAHWGCMGEAIHIATNSSTV